MARTDNLLDQPRGRDGRYGQKTLCDGCGKPVTGEHCTDDEICQGSDGPGFYLCTRKRCQDAIPEGASERQAHYTAQRERNVATRSRS